MFLLALIAAATALPAAPSERARVHANVTARILRPIAITGRAWALAPADQRRAITRRSPGGEPELLRLIDFQ